MFPISRDPPEGGTVFEPYFDGEEIYWFPISRDPPEGGTIHMPTLTKVCCGTGFQFLGILPKGERDFVEYTPRGLWLFPISRDPPEGGTVLINKAAVGLEQQLFPISRDPPEGGTLHWRNGTIGASCVSNF